MKTNRQRRGPRALLDYQKKNGIRTRSELARTLGIHESALSRFISGERKLGVNAALSISEKIGIEMAELFR